MRPGGHIPTAPKHITPPKTAMYYTLDSMYKVLTPRQGVVLKEVQSSVYVENVNDCKFIDTHVSHQTPERARSVDPSSI